MLGDPAPTPFDPGLLRLGHDLRRLGDDPVRRGWHHVRHGVWIESARWTTLTREQRHAALVHATDLVSRAPGEHVFALESAAAIWGLPAIGAWPTHVSRLASGPCTRAQLVDAAGAVPARVRVGHGPCSSPSSPTRGRPGRRPDRGRRRAVAREAPGGPA